MSAIVAAAETIVKITEWLEAPAELHLPPPLAAIIDAVDLLREQIAPLTPPAEVLEARALLLKWHGQASRKGNAEGVKEIKKVMTALSHLWTEAK